MAKLQMLWVDLTVSIKRSEVPSGLQEHCEPIYCSASEEIDRLVERHHIDVICSDFDYPDRAGLKLLRDVKLRHPSVPVIMLTVQHSEALAIWAFRNKVLDYLAKPVSRSEINRCMQTLLRIAAHRRSQSRRAASMRAEKIPEEVAYGSKLQDSVLAPAIFYVEQHFHSKIRSDNVARLCGLSPFRFSRAFKEAFGMTFREYLIVYRLHQACRLLENPATSVTDVAFAAGFNDASYFTRMFKQRLGVAPSAVVGQSYATARSVHAAMARLPMLPELLH